MPDDEIRPVWVYRPPLSGKICQPVEQFDEEFRKLLKEMWKTCAFYHGYGLAAPQIGFFFRAAVVSVPNFQSFAMANPVVTVVGDEVEGFTEGCLSFPQGHGMRARVTRPAMVHLKYQDEFGKFQELEASGILARCIQHEADHLDGTFFVDRLKPLLRKTLIEKLNRNLAKWDRHRQRQGAMLLRQKAREKV